MMSLVDIYLGCLKWWIPTWDVRFMRDIPQMDPASQMKSPDQYDIPEGYDLADECSRWILVF